MQQTIIILIHLSKQNSLWHYLKCNLSTYAQDAGKGNDVSIRPLAVFQLLILKNDGRSYLLF